jgi:hypothetical protein
MVELMRKSDYAAEPVLDEFDLNTILDNNKHGKMWAADTAFAYDDRVIPLTRNGHVYRVTEAGTTGATEPVWPTEYGDTLIDGSVTFEEYAEHMGSIYDIRGAIHEAFLLKASKATETNSGDETALFKNAEEMARKYAPVLIG